VSVYYNFYYYSIELDIDRIFQFSKKKIIVAIPSGTSDEIGTLEKKKIIVAMKHIYENKVLDPKPHKMTCFL
jgi:catabolite regulation protein CreA